MIKPFLKKNWHVFALLALLVLITYGNSLNNAFLSDDLAEIVQNPNIGNFSNIFTRPFGFIRLLVYWAAFNIGGLNPIIFRLTNILFHMGSVFLVYILLSHTFSKRLGFFAAAIFAVHPGISEAVVWISGGMYPQYSFFFLLALTLYVFSKESSKLYVASIFSYLFSLMSHPQMPLALFLIFPLWEFCFGNLRKNWPKAIPFALLAVSYVFVTLGGLPERTTTLQSTHYQQGGIDNPAVLIPVALISYFELIFFPKTLTLYHSELAFAPAQFLLMIVLTLTFLTAALIGLKKNKLIFFSSMFFLIALSPTLTPFRLNWIVAERYLYLPIIGILILLGVGFEKLCNLRNFKQACYIFLVLIIAILSVRTIIRNIDWKSEDNLWIATGKTSPSSPNTHNNLGDVYGRWGDKQAALREFQKAIELKPNYGDAYHNLANTYIEIGQPEKALENYQNAIKYNPNLWQSHQNIAAIYFAAKQYDPAIENLQRAIQINPKNLNLRVNLGIVYLVKGDKEKAKEIFSQVLNMDPNNQPARQGLIEAEK